MRYSVAAQSPLFVGLKVSAKRSSPSKYSTTFCSEHRPPLRYQPESHGRTKSRAPWVVCSNEVARKCDGEAGKSGRGGSPHKRPHLGEPQGCRRAAPELSKKAAPGAEARPEIPPNRPNVNQQVTNVGSAWPMFGRCGHAFTQVRQMSANISECAY